MKLKREEEEVEKEPEPSDHELLTKFARKRVDIWDREEGNNEKH